MQVDWERQCQELKASEAALSAYLDGSKVYKASDIHGRQEAAFELVKDLASKDDKEKLYFIPKREIRQEDR